MVTVAPPPQIAAFGSTKFDFAAMDKFAGSAVTARFKEALVDGSKTNDEDQKAIESALHLWCSSLGCINYAHW